MTTCREIAVYLAAADDVYNGIYFPRDVFDEILDLIESEGFPTYSILTLRCTSFDLFIANVVIFSPLINTFIIFIYQLSDMLLRRGNFAVFLLTSTVMVEAFYIKVEESDPVEPTNVLLSQYLSKGNC